MTVTAERLEDFDFATGEILQRYTTRNEILEIQVEVPILRRLTVFAEGADRSVRSLVDDVEDPLLADFLDDLDRDDLAYRGGVRYYPSEKLRLGAGVGYAETDFADEALDRSNSGDFWYVETGYERPKLLVDLLYQENQLSAKDGSEFSDFDSSTGGARIEWMPREAFTARLYGVAPARLFAAGRRGLRLRRPVRRRRRRHRPRLAAAPEPLRRERQPSLSGGARRDSAAPPSGSTTSRATAPSSAIELPWQMNLRVGYQESRITPPAAERPARPEDHPAPRQPRIRLRPGHLVLTGSSFDGRMPV